MALTANHTPHGPSAGLGLPQPRGEGTCGAGRQRKGNAGTSGRSPELTSQCKLGGGTRLEDGEKKKKGYRAIDSAAVSMNLRSQSLAALKFTVKNNQCKQCFLYYYKCIFPLSLFNKFLISWKV